MIETVRDLKPYRHQPADPDGEDVALARRGDIAAFERLYHNHVPRINSVAEWMLGTRDTDDVLQDIFVRAWERLATFRGEAMFGTWLRQLAINVILRFRERSRKQHERFLTDDAALQSAEAPDTFHLYTDIEVAVGKLPPRSRDVFILHDVEGYKHHEIAEMLGISANTSRWQLHEARARLRGFFA
jgi:RNA polymerase sigma-70 factor (ECF subfamily)